MSRAVAVAEEDDADATSPVPAAALHGAAAVGTVLPPAISSSAATIARATRIIITDGVAVVQSQGEREREPKANKCETRIETPIRRCFAEESAFTRRTRPSQLGFERAKDGIRRA
jgi:hypothetical protein